MLKLNEFSNNHHPSRVRMLAKYIRRGISVILICSGVVFPGTAAKSGIPVGGRFAALARFPDIPIAFGVVFA